MNHQTNNEVYRRCEVAFVQEIVKTIDCIVKRTPSLTAIEREDLLSNISFSVAAHISGSSYAGKIGECEISPVLGFYTGDGTDAACFGNGSMLHELVPEAIKALSTSS